MADAQECACRQNRRSPDCPDNPWRDPRFEVFDVPAVGYDATVRCRGCGAIFDVHYLASGGIYSDFEWRRRP